MAIKTFTTGEVLTASDTNTYLANSGLVYIKGGTITTQTNVEITDAFSSTYQNYRIMVRLTNTSTACSLAMRLGTTSTGNQYFSSVNGLDQTGAATSILVNAGNEWKLLDYLSAGAYGNFAIDIYGPQLAVVTTASGTVMSADGAGFNNGAFAGLYNVATQFTSFSLLSTAGNYSLVYRVYGYREP